MEQEKDGHRGRLRSRYLKAGGDGFTDYDIIELILTYAIPRRDVKPVARELLRKFKDVAGIMDADAKEISEISGMGSNSALLFRLMRDICVRYLENKVRDVDVISSPEKLIDYARMKLAGYADEVIMVICLNTKNHVIDAEIVSRGTIDAAVIYPRTIAADALRKKAAGVIIVHNHPSGVTQPSMADREFTRAVAEALKLLDIHLLDHLIVSRSTAFSFNEHRLLR